MSKPLFLIRVNPIPLALIYHNTKGVTKLKYFGAFFITDQVYCNTHSCKMIIKTNK